jgi:regulator of protease activity HflC (stomatin/prohibitin superfamily)
MKLVKNTIENDNEDEEIEDLMPPKEGIEMDNPIKVNNPAKMIGMLVAALIIFIVVIAFLAAMIINVPAGHKGVIVSGFDVGQQFDEGWNIKNPFSGVEMVRYNTQIEKEVISARSTDGYNVNIDFAVRYHLMDNQVGNIRVDNPDYKETVIRSILRSEARKVVSDWNMTGEEMNQKRSLYEGEVENRAKDRLDDYYIVVEDVMLRNLDFPAQVNDAWEKRAAAEVDVETAGYELEAERLRAKKELVKADAEKNATIVLAEGQAEAIRILANETLNINETVMDYILSIRYITALRDPEPNINYVIVPVEQPLMLKLPDEP